MALTHPKYLHINKLPTNIKKHPDKNRNTDNNICPFPSNNQFANSFIILTPHNNLYK